MIKDFLYFQDDSSSDFLQDSSEDSFGAYCISVNLTSGGSLHGDTLACTSSTEYSFEGISIITAGNHSFLVTIYDPEDNFIISQTIHEQNFDISEEQANLPSNISYLSSIEIKSPLKKLTAFFDFILTIKIRDQNGELWTEECDVNLSSDSLLYGSTYNSTNTGILNFTLYLKEEGNISITAHGNNSINSTITIFLLPLIQKLLVTPYIVKFI